MYSSSHSSIYQFIQLKAQYFAEQKQSQPYMLLDQWGEACIGIEMR